MAITDPALEYIESQKESLTDFIFRITGDRSRAGVLANEACAFVHGELLSSWSHEDIRVELFAHAFDMSRDALRGIDKDFLEAYYRHQFDDKKKIALFYPLELFLVEIGPELAIALALVERYKFPLEPIARILEAPALEVEEALRGAEQLLKTHPKVKIAELANLPSYSFLKIRDPHPTSISRIMVHIRPKRKLAWKTRTIVLFIAGGLTLGSFVYWLLLQRG